MKTSILATASLFIVPSLAVAKDEIKPENAANRCHYKALDSIIGADVCMKPNAEEQREGEEGGEGSITDLVVLTRDGKIGAAVVSFGGFLGIGEKTVALPCSRLSWDAEKEAFVVDATKEQLEKLSDFDLDEAREAGLDSSYVTVCEDWTAVGFPKDYHTASGVATDAASRNQASDPAAVLRGTTCTTIPVSYVCASELSDYAVETREGEDSGEVASWIVNCDSRAIEFAVINDLGDDVDGIEGDYLVPLDALTFCSKDDEECVCFVHPLASLRSAVKYESPENGVLSVADANAAKTWCAKQPRVKALPAKG